MNHIYDQRCSLFARKVTVQALKSTLVAFKQKDPAKTATRMGTRTTNSETQNREPRTWVAIATFCLCIFLACLDAVIIGNALPAIAEDLHAPSGSYAWIGAAYNMAWASLLLTWGRISDIFGRKPVLLVGALVFFLGSVIAATSGSIAALIAGRTVQGLGAGAWIVTVSACITDLFSLR